MILDDIVVHFLTNTEPLYIHLAVSNSNGMPYSVRGFGVKTYRDKNKLGIYILKSQTEKLRSYLKSGNGAVACLFTDGFSNESYQIKGQFKELQNPTSDEDFDILSRYRNGSLKLFPKMYAKYPLSAALCDLVTYKIEEIFIQTPGPYAGSKYQEGESKYDS
ncbi:hypothetical protein [Neobacillus bataviensis]|uniref:hypothetical protein n=1 Tax=Neobacillus bataviensis TaxID=220685 RepID=UPI001CBFE9AB|nr:hypothetical protein [Neobacillus bataviensis]